MLDLSSRNIRSNSNISAQVEGTTDLSLRYVANSNINRQEIQIRNRNGSSKLSAFTLNESLVSTVNKANTISELNTIRFSSNPLSDITNTNSSSQLSLSGMQSRLILTSTNSQEIQRISFPENRNSCGLSKGSVNTAIGIRRKRTIKASDEMSTVVTRPKRKPTVNQPVKIRNAVTRTKRKQSVETTTAAIRSKRMRTNCNDESI